MSMSLDTCNYLLFFSYMWNVLVSLLQWCLWIPFNIKQSSFFSIDKFWILIFIFIASLGILLVSSWTYLGLWLIQLMRNHKLFSHSSWPLTEHQYLWHYFLFKNFSHPCLPPPGTETHTKNKNWNFLVLNRLNLSSYYLKDFCFLVWLYIQISKLLFTFLMLKLRPLYTNWKWAVTF